MILLLTQLMKKGFRSRIRICVRPDPDPITDVQGTGIQYVRYQYRLSVFLMFLF
jgi:hypothetical protein